VSGPVVPRVAPGDRRAVGLVAWVVARVSGRVTGTTPPNLFLVLGRHRGLFRGWLHFAGRLMPGGALPRRETELVILRVAHLRANAYELEHHRRLAARARITPDEVERVLDGPAAEGWTARERAILGAVDELHHLQDLTDPCWATLRDHLGEREAIELVLLVGHYEMLATAITALRVPPDHPRRGRG
jgi:AhpD family alkylhydroperoxidase